MQEEDLDDTPLVHLAVQKKKVRANDLSDLPSSIVVVGDIP